jgi:hypothetical protein
MAKRTNEAADEGESQAADPAEEQFMPESKPADYVPEDQQFAEYTVSMTDKQRKGVYTVRFPTKGFPGGFPVTFVRPDQTSRTVNTNAAIARQLRDEGWQVEKAS